MLDLLDQQKSLTLGLLDQTASAANNTATNVHAVRTEGTEK
jgi:hypothetical protein